jgi:hypothetical protein
VSKHTAQSLESLGKEIQYTLTTAKAKLSELQRAIADLDLPAEDPRPACPACSLRMANEQFLTEHLENVHGVRAA